MVKVSIRAHTNSKKPRIEKDLLGTYHVHVHEPPVGGEANRAIIDSLSRFLNVKRNRIFIVSGKTSKDKVCEVIRDNTQHKNSCSIDYD